MTLVPGNRIGIIGGGQLGRMLAIAANRLGFLTTVLDPAADAPAFQCSHGRIIGGYDDPAALKQLAEACDVITYEFENVDVAAVQSLESRLPCHPPSSALATSQDRLVEKQFFNNLGIATAPFRDVENPEQMGQALAELGGKAILKTRRFGYDGKGQLRLDASAPASIDEALDEASEMASKTPCILEGFVNFRREISIIASRGQDGAVKCFDIVENVHRNGILFTSTVPAHSDAGTLRRAHEIAEKVLPALDYVGVLAIEFFETDDGNLLVNEFAPRVHNSGHWTEAACTISQFEQHIRAVAGLPLGDTRRHSNCVMENLIGDEIVRAPEILKMENTLLHLYGKSETRAGRKMGHFTTITPMQDQGQDPLNDPM